jgi:DNA-binding NtrC family response regulator
LRVQAATGAGVSPPRSEAEPRLFPSGGGAWLGRSLAEVRQEAVAEVEREYLKRLLVATRGHLRETARRAGIDSRSLYNKMRRYGLRKESFRAGAPGA